MNSYSIETLAVHAGYETDEATMSVTPPLYETNAYVFKDAEHARTLFELKEPGNIYSRLQNPTCDILVCIRTCRYIQYYNKPLQ